MANVQNLPHSGGSQFFINTADNDFLDWFIPENECQNPVFGKVVSGTDVITAINLVECDERDKPKIPIIVYNITVIENLNEFIFT